MLNEKEKSPHLPNKRCWLPQSCTAGSLVGSLASGQDSEFACIQCFSGQGHTRQLHAEIGIDRAYDNNPLRVRAGLPWRH